MVPAPPVVLVAQESILGGCLAHIGSTGSDYNRMSHHRDLPGCNFHSPSFRLIPIGRADPVDPVDLVDLVRSCQEDPKRKKTQSKCEVSTMDTRDIIYNCFILLRANFFSP